MPIPSITNPGAQTLTVNQAFTINIAISNTPTTVMVTGLLEGLVYTWINATNTLQIYGTPTALGAGKTWMVTATNNDGTATLTIIYNVVELTPIIPVVAAQTVTKGMAFTLTVAITNNPSGITVEGLITGLVYTASNTGVTISGTVPTAANFTVTTGVWTITASNSGGVATRTINYTISG